MDDLNLTVSIVEQWTRCWRTAAVLMPLMAQMVHYGTVSMPY